MRHSEQVSDKLETRYAERPLNRSSKRRRFRYC